MEATSTYNGFSMPSFPTALANFFRTHTPESSKVLFWKMFQCWTLKDCKIRAEVSDEEVALFFDQLDNLVTAAYQVHQANRIPASDQGDNSHD